MLSKTTNRKKRALYQWKKSPRAAYDRLGAMVRYVSFITLFKQNNEFTEDRWTPLHVFVMF